MIFQMIGFVEGLPAKWESKWKSMQMKSSHDLEVEEGKQIDKLYNLLLILLKDCKMLKLEQKFAEIVHNPTLKPLLQVIQGLMQFLPCSHLTADKALDLLYNTQK